MEGKFCGLRPRPLGVRALVFEGWKNLMFLRKTLEDVVEDVDSARIFAWKTQNQLFKLKKKLYSFTGFASSREMRGRCPRLPGCLPASSYRTRGFSQCRSILQYIFLLGARGRSHIKPKIQCCSDITFFTGEWKFGIMSPRTRKKQQPWYAAELRHIQDQTEKQ